MADKIEQSMSCLSLWHFSAIRHVLNTLFCFISVSLRCRAHSARQNTVWWVFSLQKFPVCQRKLWMNFVFPSGRLLWNSTTAFQERCHWPGMKHFHAFKPNISVQWHMTKAFTGTISDFDPLSPRRSCCGSEALHKNGQIRLFCLRKLGIFHSGVSSWKLQSQICLSSLPVCQK